MKSIFTFKSIVPLMLLPCMALCGTSESFAQEEAGPAVIAADPASGTKVESLSEIILTMDQETVDAAEEWKVECIELPQVFGAPSDVKAVLWYPQGDLTKLKITITPALTQDGTYEVTIPEGYICSKNAWVYNRETKLVYTIGSGTSGEEPVKYDVTYTSIEPGPGTYEALNAVTLTFDTDVVVLDRSRASLYQNNMLYVKVPMAARDGNKVDLLFDNFDIQGTYELVIEKAQIGDAKWAESNHLGHSNPEFRIPGYKIKKQAASKLTYDFEPVLSPDGTDILESLDRVTLTFDGAWCAASEQEIALYDYKGDGYPLSVSLGETLNEAVLTPAAPVKEAGQYRLVIPKGRFANTDFEETAGQEGALNPDIDVTFNVNPLGSIQETGTDGITVSVIKEGLLINGRGHASIYSVQGVPVASLEVSGSTSLTLDTGVYIVRAGLKSIKACVK